MDRIEVASARVSSGEQQALRNIINWAAEHELDERVEVLGFVDYNRSVDWIREAGGKVINLLVKGSEKHCTNQLGKTLERHVADILKPNRGICQKQGMHVNCYLEDGPMVTLIANPMFSTLMKAIGDCGIEHFMLPDTLGVMSPDEVFAALTDMRSNFPDQVFDFHPHNDYGLATANCMAAVRAGITNLHCTMNCLGERAGNVSLAELTVVLRDKLGIKTGIDESHLHHISVMVEQFSGKYIAANMPILGQDVFTPDLQVFMPTVMLRVAFMKLRLSPERFDRKRTYALGKLSGKASVLKNIEELGITLSDENLKRVLDEVVSLEIQRKPSRQMIYPSLLRTYLKVTITSISVWWTVKSRASLAASQRLTSKWKLTVRPIKNQEVVTAVTLRS